jgi:hypothetical protein
MLGVSSCVCSIFRCGSVAVPVRMQDRLKINNKSCEDMKNLRGG